MVLDFDFRCNLAKLTPTPSPRVSLSLCDFVNKRKSGFLEGERSHIYLADCCPSSEPPEFEELIRKNTKKMKFEISKLPET